ncbi:MAG: hypothetical protein N2449_07430 [Bacteroidales bacterium]|nr:hypothetical protein [Bacteroidales bacterium]
MRAAVIDLGTNTFNLLIADKQNNTFYEIYRDKRSVKIGKNGIAHGEIASDAYERAIAAIKDYAEIIKKYQTQHIKAIATSAFRSTKNGNQLAKEIEQIVNAKVEIIDGDKEAEFIYYGIKTAVPLTEHNVLMLDIGGGSNELIIGNKHKIEWKESYPLGISRLIDIFKPNDPLTPNNINEISEYIKTNIQSLKDALNLYPVHTLVGSSGSFDLIANMLHFREKQKPLDPMRTFNQLNVMQTIRLLDTLIISSFEQRKDMPGMDMTRIEMIPVAALFIRIVLEFFKCKQILHSVYAIKEGVWIKSFL